jgi:hypothetical protein
MRQTLTQLHQRLFPHLHSVHLDAITVSPHRVILSVSSRAVRACCPVCQHWSRRVHSRFTRTLADLPCTGWAVTLHLAGRRFFCTNAPCERRTFREQVHQIAPVRQRHTVALRQPLEQFGFTLGGRPAARLAAAQGLTPFHRRPPQLHRRNSVDVARVPGPGIPTPLPLDSSHCPSRMTFLRAVRAAPPADLPTEVTPVR